MTGDLNLRLDFAGEIHDLAPGRTFVIGRQGDLAIDDNPFLHRHFLELAAGDGLWWVTNVGSRTAAHLTDRRGLMRTTLAPGARQPLVFAETVLTFTAGSTSYEVLLETMGAPYYSSASTVSAEGDTTIAPSPLTDSQRLAIVALAEPVLRRAGTGASRVPSAVDAAARLGWPQTTFNRKLDNICEKLERSGVEGLRGAPGASAANRRALLVEYAVSTLLVTADDLALLGGDRSEPRRQAR